MLTILGSLIGFAASAFPELLALFKGAQDNKQELAMYQLQIQAAQLEGIQKLDELAATADIASITAAHAPQVMTGVRWIDALNGSVRPIITYIFFAVYAGIKIITIHKLGTDAILNTPWLIWTDSDMGMFSSIISFWFGQRMMTKYRNNVG